MVYTQEGVMKDSRPWAKIFVTGAMAVTLAAGMFAQTFAASTVVVTPTDEQGWTDNQTGVAQTRANGQVNFVEDADTHLGEGALQLVTGATDGGLDKAQYKTTTLTQLGDINDLGYWTKQVSASFAAGLPSFELTTCLYGVGETNCNPAPEDAATTTAFTNFVYEPYVSGGNAAVLSNTWQEWNIAQDGYLRSTGNIGSSTVNLSGYPVWTLDELQTMFPDATVFAYGVNVGSYNPNYDTRVDGVTFNNNLYDFELVTPDTTAPDVVITNPTEGAEVQGDAMLEATITEDVELLRYYYFVRNVNTGQNVVGPTTVYDEDQLINFSKTVDTTGWTDGEYLFQLEARDAADNKDAGSTDRVRFMVNNVVDTKEDCKDGGWMTLLTESKTSFKNQGQCVSYVVASEKASFKRNGQ